MTQHKKNLLTKKIEFHSISCHKLTKVLLFSKQKKSKWKIRNDRKGIYYIFTFVYCFRNIIINLSLSNDFLIFFFLLLPFTFHSSHKLERKKIECWMILIQSCKIVNDKYKYIWSLFWLLQRLKNSFIQILKLWVY